MTITEAIQEAKTRGDWSVVDHEPSSINVWYMRYMESTSVQLDTWGDNHEKELENLWDEMCEEFGSTLDGVISVEALGYIEE